MALIGIYFFPTYCRNNNKISRVQQKNCTHQIVVNMSTRLSRRTMFFNVLTHYPGQNHRKTLFNNRS
ncbi:hypothetical protein TOT_040000893 [Theileria orientalis strain Shintoku]|uniref:Uncharacterized protein n=1 Tax=Theileria orientalis strain Shintoku TaxID=869250 RepID=J7MF92_THEOR|nr:hypothetical protein TOT_040000893 [Theileria orientalis strain Shintoku]BAM42524.1 hypothetical protein TOT_040000893 [Theileria orientalis strain Shintoku]|eukprot:XP_009692825.1 hypothetical protein TOT_040000893 [Theileria orientalis strain Shintoku]